MITKQQYIEYLISTPVNYTCSNLAEHLNGVSHDAVTDYLHREKLSASHLWEIAQAFIQDGPASYLIVDDSVQDKRYSRAIELVKRQYSGAAGGLVRGIGVVNLVHSDGQGEYYPIDFRVYAKEQDGKTKNDHFIEMVTRAVTDKGIQAKTVLFDSWYGSWQNLKRVDRLGLTFYTTLKSNRLVSPSKEVGYIHLGDLDWTPELLHNGYIVKLKKVPFLVKLFKLVAPNGDIDWVITNAIQAEDDDLDSAVTAPVAQEANDVRWNVEQFHREVKQLTGSQRCQCRKQRAQRNHLACAYQAWFAMKVHAQKLSKTIYRVKHDLLSDYLRAELRNPRVPALLPA